MGRKKKDRSDKLLRSFETTKPLDDRLREEAFIKHKSISALIREILELHYEER
jgi:hypothetical protein